MPRPNISTIDHFDAYVEDRPSRLACWRLGSSARHEVLSWLQTESIREQQALALIVGPGESSTKAAAAHHNQVGIAGGWVSRHMIGPGRQREVRDQDLFALRKTAADYWILRNALAEVRAGVRGFEVTGTRVRLPYQGNHEVDALDRLLDMAQAIETISKAPKQPMPVVREWMYGEGLSRPWLTTPERVKQAFRDWASELLALYPRYVPADFVVVGGVHGSELDAFWCELLAWGMQMQAAIALGSSDAPTIAPLVPRDEFIDRMAEATGTSRSVVELIVELLTLDDAQCKDCALTPLFPIDGSLLPLVSLIIPGSPHRNFLAILQLRPDLYGEVGRMLGRAGERMTLELLGRMHPEVRIGSRIRVQRPDGTQAGDFDIVAFDPRTSAGVVLEIQWRLGADGNAEVYKAEQAAIQKRSQVTRLRDEILGGAVPQWPATWPDMTHCNLRWFVLTHDVLATREVEHDGVTIRSYQLLSRTLRAGASLADLVSALDSPPAPPPELCQTRWKRIHYGDLRVDLECIVA